MPQKSKISYKNVYDYIKLKGCDLQSTEYVNMKQKLSIRCSCGKIYITTFDNFKNKECIRCKECVNKLKSKSKSIKYDYVKKYIESQGCSLLSGSIKTAHDKIEIRCSCGEVFLRSFNKFKSGQTKCLKCNDRTKWDIDIIREYVTGNSSSVLLSDEYTNKKSILKFLCECGDIYETQFRNFLYSNKRLCNKCSTSIKIEKLKIGIDVIKKRVEEKSDCELLSDDYSDYYSKLLFKCSCGETFTTSYMSFVHGKTKCDECSEYSKGEAYIENYLKGNNINYDKQVTFKDLKGVNNGLLRFDFVIKFKEIDVYLEYDGEQHFKPNRYSNGEEKFLITQKHDSLKNSYCQHNGLILERIKYTDFHKLDGILNNIIHKYGNPVPSKN